VSKIIDKVSDELYTKYPLLYKRIISELPESYRKIDIVQDTLIMEFNSPEHIADIIEQYIYIHETIPHSSMKDDYSFSQSMNIEEAISFVRGTETPSNLETIKNNIINKLLAKGIIGEYFSEEVKFKDEGIEIDISRYLAGEKECFYAFKEYKKMFYSLNINLAVLSGVSSKVYQKNIEKILTTIHNLELEDGVSIEVNGVVYSRNVSSEGDAMMVIFPIKRYNDYLDINKLLAVTHVSFFRRLIFFIREAVWNDKLSNGYGQSVNSQDFMLGMNSQKEFRNEDILERFMNQYEIGKLKNGKNNYWKI